MEYITYLENEELLADAKKAKKIVNLAQHLVLLDHILYYVDTRQDNLKCVAGHFSGEKLYNILVRDWWWEGMYTDTHHYCRNCPECTITTGSGSQSKPPLQPITVS